MALASYLLGYLAYFVSQLVDRITTFGFSKDASDARQAVSLAARGQDAESVPQIGAMLLLSRIQLTHREAATEISRFRATGLMLRSATVPTFLAALLACVELIVGPRPAVAGVCMAVFVLMTIGFARYGAQLRYWANTKTYEFGYWTGVERPIRDTAPPGMTPVDPRG